jgi:prepilin-type N-terminal cleavage/methylation domain-containing protein
MNAKGFSALEIIIAIAIAGILLSISVNSYQISKLKKDQEQILLAIESALEEQRVNTQSGKEGKNFGVKFNQNDFVLFSGTSYSPSDQNKIVAVDPQFQITETITHTDNIIYFSKLLGDANQHATITISHITNRIPVKNILIEKSGTISVIE